jgi:drug/metabolite transporter (DMT)-like permease
MGILLGILTALSWGSSDLLARSAARKIGTLRAMLYMQLAGLLLLSAALHWLGGWSHLVNATGWRPWGWGIVAGVLNMFATLALYRSFEIGKMSVVAPISSSYAALTMMLDAVTGERLTPVRLAGLVLILLGVIIVARGQEIPDDANPIEPGNPGKKHLGVKWAFVAAFGYGLLFWVLGVRAVPLLGSAQTVWVIRLTCVVLSFAVAGTLRRSAALPDKGAKWPILGMGLLDTSAYVLNNYGMRLEQVSVVTVLSSLYGAVTVGLAATILKERISRVQSAGIVAIFAGIGLISW